MPTKKTKKSNNKLRKNDLPKQVTNVLSPKAQEIYMKAYNNAIDQYKDPKKRRGKQSQKQVASKVAWNAVKQKYEKKENQWQHK